MVETWGRLLLLMTIRFDSFILCILWQVSVMSSWRCRSVLRNDENSRQMAVSRSPRTFLPSSFMIAHPLLIATMPTMNRLFSLIYLAALSHLCPAAALRPAQQLARSRRRTPTGIVQHKQERPTAFHLDTTSTSIVTVPRGGGGKVAVDGDRDQDDALAKFAESIRSAIDQVLIRIGVKQEEIPPPPVEKPTFLSRVGSSLSVIGAFVSVQAVVELAGGNGDLFLQLDGASLLIAVLASVLSSADIARIMNRGVISLGILLGSMHLLTV